MRRAAGLLGCLAALAAAAALGLPFLLFTVFAGCAPDEACRREDPLFVYGGLALVAGLAALLGFAVRALAGWALARRGASGGGRFPVWAAVAAGLVAAILAWVGWRIAPFLND